MKYPLASDLRSVAVGAPAVPERFRLSGNAAAPCRAQLVRGGSAWLITGLRGVSPRSLKAAFKVLFLAICAAVARQVLCRRKHASGFDAT